MTYREEYLTVSFGESINKFCIVSKEQTDSCCKYFLFNRFNIFNKKINVDDEVRRIRKKEFNRLNKQKIFIDNYYSEPYQNNKEKYLLIAVSFNNPKIVEYQIKLMKKYVKGNFVHIICDNSNKIESAIEIKKVCENNQTTYIRINAKITPNGYSDSHGVALNWIFENIIKYKQKDFALLDHDIVPIIEQNIDDYFNKQDFFGQIRFKDENNHKDVWSLWPGFAFYKYSVVKNKKLNFRRYKHFGIFKACCVDTGSANWKPLYSKYNANDLISCDVVSWDLKNDVEFKPNGNKNSDFEDCVEYFNNKTWLHAINGSEWHESNGKINFVYKRLEELLRP